MEVTEETNPINRGSVVTSKDGWFQAIILEWNQLKPWLHFWFALGRKEEPLWDSPTFSEERLLQVIINKI